MRMRRGVLWAALAGVALLTSACTATIATHPTAPTTEAPMTDTTPAPRDATSALLDAAARGDAA
ncbi:hypothetical protein, partial [Microbacterium sp. K35]|uniref:hypothetical protein n=1 Tax=Microbacterium sp. K35 TaxID=2305440 RepID=UPI00406C44F3